jgi:hypothetical protein
VAQAVISIRAIDKRWLLLGLSRLDLGQARPKLHPVRIERLLCEWIGFGKRVEWANLVKIGK